MCVSTLFGILQIGFYVIFVRTSASVSIHQLITQANTTQSNPLEILLTSIQNEQNFSTMVLWRRKSTDCFAELSNCSTAKLIFNGSHSIYLNAHYSRELLTLVCLDDFVDLWLLEKMSDSLRHMRETRVLFLLKNFTTSQQEYMRKLFSYCDQQQMLNVLAIRKDFATTGLFYTFTRFPNFTMDEAQWPSLYYPHRLKNLHGYELRTMASQSEPGSIVYTDHQGRKRSSGYVYHLIATYAAQLNANLTYKMRLNAGASIETSILANLTGAYELDLPICLQIPVENMSLHGLSHIVEISNWMPMLPRSGYIERSEIYKHILSRNTFIIDVVIFIIFSLLYIWITNEAHSVRRPGKFSYNEVFFNDKIFRGVIGLSFQLRKERNYKFYLLYFLIFLQGIIWSTVYCAQLNGFFSRPPSGEQINTYDDLKMRGIQIAIPLEEFELLEKFMSKAFMRTYRDIFLMIPELRDFYALRKSLNTRFAYSTHSEIWAMVARQQLHFSQRLFRVSEEVQFHRQTLLAVPLAENSVYRASFNAYLLDMQAYGFWNHWTAMSLFEMVEAGKLSLEDFVEPLGYKALQLRDLYYIWWIYISGIATSCFCILVEVLHQKLKRDGQQYLAPLWNQIEERLNWRYKFSNFRK
ncbi:uncharacterized protein LOC129243599 [Anastrepha obliqua]|uniref:uncharacterized protein LOC129243599 n=1 Tax=Anastrepha obliqua TaxID=95512 RepID=UPI002409367D|nr:uncharacterized protein LOC129243599 [Anastrepha obliqua]